LSSAPADRAADHAARQPYLTARLCCGDPMEEIRILSPTGVFGSGFLEESFEKALAKWTS
jgi:hypothetical protein